MIRKLVALTFLISFIPLESNAGFDYFFKPRSYILLTGSSTISPLAAAISEEFSRTQNLQNSPVKTPVVESTGTGEGFRLFCNGTGRNHPDFVNASRQIEDNELKKCSKNGVNGVVEIKIGYDGIVIGNSINSSKFNLSKEQIFAALAQKIFDEKSEKFVNNPYKKWSEIDPSLPETEILVFGPPLTSGTRDIFNELLMESACFAKKEFVDAYEDGELRRKICRNIRDDGAFIASGENDNLIIQNLKNNPNALGIFGFNFLVTNQTVMQAAQVENVAPSFESIASKQYPLSRPLFIYFKKEHLDLIPKMREFVNEIISAETLGSNGYLLHNGLIALTDDELNQVRKAVSSQLKKD